MAISITVDNNRNNNTPTFTADPLLQDESAGTQVTGSTTDDGNEVNVTATADGAAEYDVTLGGLQTDFNSFLNAATIFTYASLRLTDAQKLYAASVDGASSNSDFVKVETTANETITDLFFSGANGQPLNGAQVFISAGVPLQTLSGDNIYLYTDGDFAIATTSGTAGAGRVVAAFYLNENTTDHKTAQVQMVTFEAIKHPNAADPTIR